MPTIVFYLPLCYNFFFFESAFKHSSSTVIKVLNIFLVFSIRTKDWFSSNFYLSEESLILLDISLMFFYSYKKAKTQ